MRQLFSAVRDAMIPMAVAPRRGGSAAPTMGLEPMDMERREEVAVGRLRFGAVLLACLLMCVGTVAAAAPDTPASPVAGPDAADYARSLGLRENWMYLTEGIPGAVTWLDAQRFVYRRSVRGGFEFVERRVGEEGARPAFDHAALARALGQARGETIAALRLPFIDFQSVDEGRMIEFQLDDGRWRCTLAPVSCEKSVAATRGQPRAWGVVRDLSVPADATPKPSPDGRYEAFVENHNLMLRQRDSGEVRALSHDGSARDFHDPQSLVWSPDSRRVAIYRVKPGSQRKVFRVESAPAGQLHTHLQSQLYPKPGDAVDIETPVLFDIENGSRIEVDNVLFPMPYQLSPLYFRADGGTLAFRYVERSRKRVRLIEIDAESGKTRSVIEETADTFVNDWWHRSFFHDVGRRGEEILWMSERDGWNHLYLFNGNSGQPRQLTRGEWVVRQVLRVDEDRREVWFAASGREPGDPYLQHVYRMDFDGENLLHLTPDHGWHEIALSPDGLHYTDTWSRIDQPDVMQLRDARDGRLLATLEQADVAALTAAGYRPPEAFVAPGRDGITPIHGIIVRPADYDPARRYRVIENIYAGPHDAFVPKTWWPFGYHSGGDKPIGMQALADLGFIVVQIDSMGTMHRSKAFHDVTWKNLGDAGFPDRIAWHRALAARDSSYDIEGGIGIYGASAGGQNALSALLFHGDVYSVAVGMNGCYDNRMDKLSWNEQWMGWPVDESYARASGVDNAHRLQGQLLMILGEQDANVDPASTYQVADALIRAGKDFDLLVVPGGGHAVGRSEEPIDYVHRRMFDFFVRHLMGEKTPDWNKPQ